MILVYLQMSHVYVYSVFFVLQHRLFKVSQNRTLFWQDDSIQCMRRFLTMC